MSGPVRGISGPDPQDLPLSADPGDVAEQRAPLDPEEVEDRDLPHTADDRPEADVIEQWAEVPDDGFDDYR